MWALAIFLVALALSHAVQFWRERTQSPPADEGKSVARLLAPGAPVDGERVTLAYLDEGPGSPGSAARAHEGAHEGADSRDERPVVVLLHGSPGSGGDFARLTPLLTARGYRVIAPDMPGFGRSDPWPAREGAAPMFALARDDYSIRAHADAVLALLEHLGVARAHLVGWSMGGGVALHAADVDHARVDRAGGAPGARVASVTLMASVGTQANEGSGLRAVERVKYALTLLPIAYAPEALPHFGLLGPHSFRRAAFRNFWDTDLRALEDVCRRTRVPTLVLQGENDVLVPWRSATHYHAIIPGARLIATDANHFLPFLQAEETANDLLAFFAAAEGRAVSSAQSGGAGAPASAERAADAGFDGALAAALATPGAIIDRAPTVERGRVSAWLDRAGAAIAGPRWAWAQVLALALLAYRSRPWAAVVAGLFLAPPLHLDWGACAMGLALGALLRPLAAMVRREPAGHDRADAEEWRRRLRATPVSTAWRSNVAPWLERESGPGWLRALTAPAGSRRGGLAWGALAFWPVRIAAAWVSSVVTLLALATFVPQTLRAWELGAGWLGVVAALLLARLVAGAVPLLLARGGRQLLRAELARWTHHEWWPAWLFYLPLWWHAPRLGLKHGGVTLPGCVNPGIPNAGGWIGEPKHLIDQGLGALDPGVRAMVAPALLVPAGEAPERRAALARDLVRERLGNAYPVIVKPDAAQRGFSVRLVREPAQFEAYFRATPIAAVVQPFAPGPVEAGVLWVRDPASVAPGPATPARTDAGGARVGRIFSVTRKTFATVTGDGRRTIEDLVLRHPRLRKQAGVFMARLRARRSEVPARGEVVRLGNAGNHCQGTLFSDGADLITPALHEALERVALSYRGPGEAPEGGALGLPGGGLDFARFDVRAPSEDDLRAGRHLTIIEANGTSSESTNIYDPARSLAWAWGVLLEQYRVLFALGAARRDAGVRPPTPRWVLAALARYYRARRGSALAD